jgi:hypothetical protein
VTKTTKKAVQETVMTASEIRLFSLNK